MSRRLAALIAGALCLLALAGCGPQIQSFTVTQDEVGGPVRIVAEICDDDGTACSPFATGNGYQWIVAYALPEGARVLSVKTTGTSELELVESESYRDWLDANEPAPAGLDWVAFRSDTIGDVSGADPVWRVEAVIQPSGAGDEPITAFPYVARYGARTRRRRRPGRPDRLLRRRLHRHREPDRHRRAGRPR